VGLFGGDASGWPALLLWLWMCGKTSLKFPLLVPEPDAAQDFFDDRIDVVITFAPYRSSNPLLSNGFECAYITFLAVISAS